MSYVALTAKTGPKDYTPKHDFNAMDCTDIVIGTARGEMSRIWDYYTRDRSTPRMDTFYGGKSELQATGGFEKDGITTIVFRKKLDASEPTDHSITDDLMHVIWAKGQVRMKAAGNENLHIFKIKINFYYFLFHSHSFSHRNQRNMFTIHHPE